MIQFIAFTPDKQEKFVSFVMLMVGSIVEATYIRPNASSDTIKTEAILIVGADDEGLYFSRNLVMANHSWVLKKSAEAGNFGNFYCLYWDNIKSLIYIGNYEEANSHLSAQA